MIKLTDSNGRAVYVAPSSVAGIQQLPASSSNARSVICLLGGKLIEVQEDAAAIAADVGTWVGLEK